LPTAKQGIGESGKLIHNWKAWKVSYKNGLRYGKEWPQEWNEKYGFIDEIVRINRGRPSAYRSAKQWPIWKGNIAQIALYNE